MPLAGRALLSGAASQGKVLPQPGPEQRHQGDPGAAHRQRAPDRKHLQLLGCKNIPAGDQKVALHIKGNKTPETTTQLYVKGGVQYLHVANVDAQKKVSVQRVVIPSGVTCEEAKPAW